MKRTLFSRISVLLLAAVLSACLTGCTPESEETEETGETTESAESNESEYEPAGESSECPAEEESAEEILDAKPVIYLYPEEETDVSVSLDYAGRLTCTYPAYENGWNVTASPDGTLTDGAGQTYRYLYWEGEDGAVPEITSGFAVKGCDTAAFLEDALSKLGLNRAEANEFIVYWLPQMQDSAYNLISFDTSEYEQRAPLSITPEPDTVIRVFMTWTPSEEAVDLPEEELTAPARTGFTAVEWGGCRIG